MLSMTETFNYPHKTGVILCGGEGSRMSEVTDQVGLPKHLLDIGNEQSPATRLAMQLSQHCDKLICTTRSSEAKAQFDKHFAEAGIDVTTVIREPLAEQKGDLAAVEKEMWPLAQLLITNGDLVFEEDVISDFIAKHYKLLAPSVRGREGNPEQQHGKFDVFNSRISVANRQAILSYINNGVPAQILTEVIRMVRGQVVKVPTIGNIDTPEDLERIRKVMQTIL